jgi:adenylate kinase
LAIFGITGTPGTGKKSISPIVAERLRVECLSLNELANSYHLVKQSSGDVDVGRLRTKLRRGLPRDAVAYGHLLPYVLDSRAVSRVVVLRCEPVALKERLRARGYEPKKIVEDVEAELIGVVSSDAFDTFGKEKTWEVDTTRTTPGEAAAIAARIAESGPRPTPRIDWTLDYDSGAKLRLLLSTVE